MPPSSLHYIHVKESKCSSSCTNVLGTTKKPYQVASAMLPLSTSNTAPGADRPGRSGSKHVVPFTKPGNVLMLPCTTALYIIHLSVVCEESHLVTDDISSSVVFLFIISGFLFLFTKEYCMIQSLLRFIS